MKDKFKELKDNFNSPEMEKHIISFWEKENIFQKSIEIRKNAPDFIFYEGPPTANGKPGIHHIITRAIKDLICRYKTMRGFKVERKAGWDTHGLPVEIEVEKELKLDSKAKIEEYGIDKFNAKCKESVFRFKKEWDELTVRIGYWLDLEHPYITCSNEYIESVWWILSEFFKKGLIYQGHKIVPYCPRCGTALSSHEVAQGYEEVSDPSLYVKMKLEDEPNTYFLVWTTTPWTLLSNVALAVNSEASYVKVEYKGEYWILAEALANRILKEEFKVVDRFLGKELERKRYLPLYSFGKIDKNKAYYVVLGDFVTLADGTGIVHIAPAFGADDYNVGKIYNLPLLQLVDTSGNLTEEVTPWKGMFIKDADPKIIQDLKERNILYKSELYTHTYPFCWRCDSPLIYYARKSWYIQTTAFKDKLIANNGKINWYPPEIGTGRFGEWLENNVDWALSRERYWGTPLNIWICEKCGEQKSIPSIAELRRLGENVSQELDLHKPYIDKITLKCEKCQGKMYRTPEVIDCWFDSGAMPYAQWHYPFENEKDFLKDKFPAEFISEAVDQTRGWFYSLLAISTFLFDQPAYKNVIVIEHIQDKYGLKMSKTKGNMIDAWEVLDVQGADALRWYLVSVSAPWLPTRVDKDAITEVERKFLSTLRNSYTFFALYANIDQFDPAKQKIEVAKRAEIDRWLISKFNSLVKETTKALDGYDITKAARIIQDFVIEDLSNWYVRRNRKRFWKSAEDEDKLSAYHTLWENLVVVTKLTAPYTPFMAEELYQELVRKSDEKTPLSVHLTDFPVADENLIDTKLEEKMEGVKQVVSLGRAARNKSAIKVRQPLAEMQIFALRKSARESLKSVSDIIAEELNIKKINILETEPDVITLTAKPNFSLLGPKLGKKLNQTAEIIKTLTTEELKKFKKEPKISLAIDGETIVLEQSDLEIKEVEKEGWVKEEDSSFKVVLNTSLTEELKDEGFARELVNKIQNMRKSAGFEVTDRIKIDILTTARVKKALSSYEDYVKKETLAKAIEQKGEKGEFSQVWDINREKAEISIKRV